MIRARTYGTRAKRTAKNLRAEATLFALNARPRPTVAEMVRRFGMTAAKAEAMLAMREARG